MKRKYVTSRTPAQPRCSHGVHSSVVSRGGACSLACMFSGDLCKTHRLNTVNKLNCSVEVNNCVCVTSTVNLD